MSLLKIWLAVLISIILGCIPPPPETPTPLYDLGVARFDPIIFIKVDDAFENWQKKQIAQAFADWERASNYKISFQITWDEPKPGPYWQYQKPYENSGLFLWYLPLNEDFVPIDKLDQWKRYVGLMVYGKGENSGNVIIFDNVKEYQFYSVALHEIGHLLGLKHIEGQPVVMHPRALGDCLSQYDVQQLCELYGCNPVSQCTANQHENEGIRTSSTLLWQASPYFEFPQEKEWKPFH